MTRQLPKTGPVSRSTSRPRLALNQLEDRLAPAFGDLLQTIGNPFPAATAGFGTSVSVSGNLAVVGSPLHQPGGVFRAGAAYVFDLTTGARTYTLANPSPTVNDYFGQSVSVSGNLAVVGAPFDDPGGVADAGSVYIFDVTTGALLHTIANPSPGANDQFGASVSISGNRVVVGAPTDDPGGVTDAGSMYVFDAGSGALLHSIANPAPAASDYFGWSVSVSGARAVAGAPFDDPGGVGGAGSAYVFDVGTGGLLHTLNNPAPASNEYFGWSVAASNTRAVVGAPWDNPGGVATAGSVHVYDLTSGAGLRTLNNPAPAAGDFFGQAVAVAGNVVVVGAPTDDPGGVVDAGTAFAFDADTGNPLGTLANPAPAGDDNYGSSVAVANGRTVVGAPNDDAGATDAGSAYAFETRIPPTAVDDVFTVGADTGANILDVRANDAFAADLGETLTVVSVTQPGTGGTTAVVPGGTAVTFTPTAGFLGTTTFTYTVSDGQGGTDSATVTVNVSNVPPPPPPPPPPGPPPPAPPPGTVPPEPAAVGGPLDGTARVLTPSGASPELGGSLTFFPGAGVNVRTATADVTGDGIPDYVGGAGPGGAPQVVVVDGATGATLVSFLAFEETFRGGLFVAAEDLDGDGKAEVVVTPDRSGGPVVAIYRGSQLAAGIGGQDAQLARFFGIQGDPNFRGGCRPALGDLNGDGTPDLVIAAGVQGGPRIALFDGKGLATGGDSPPKLRGDFFAFENSLRNGSFVAAGDVTGDGRADLAFGGGPRGAPRVRLFDGAGLLAAGSFDNVDEIGGAQRANFFAGDPTLRGGVRLALRDVDGNTRADLLTGSGEGEASRVRLYTAANLLANVEPAPDREYDPFGAVLANGVFVG